MLKGPGNKNKQQEVATSSSLEWKRKMLVFSFFLAISVVIWLLNALSKNYTTDIKYPVTYSKFPQGKIMVSNMPNHLELKVNAHGYALLSYKLINRPVPINFAINSFAMNRLNGDSSRLYLLTNYAREQIGRQLPSELQLLEISPDSLIFQFATLREKRVPVQANINYKLESDFTLQKSMSINPDTVTVSGPDIYVDTLTSVHSKKANLGVLEKSYFGTIDLVELPRLDYNTNQIDCRIELEKLTEIQLQVPINVAGLPDSMRLQTFPQTIKVSGMIGLSKYESIVPEAFWLEVDYSAAIEGKSRLQVQLKSAPDNLRSVSYNPQSVEYLLSVK